ncbi:MAG: hypothetical protein H6Q04_2144 [Acidobacteria bacterium]|nr:hypothetical protein [Acidobacteriota bacterium]
MKIRSQKIMSLGSYLTELLVYACFVSAYFFLVLHFLGDWVKQVFDENKALYAILALALILVQGYLLEILTSALLRMIRSKGR